MSPEDLQEVVAFLNNKGVDDDTIKSVSEGYQEADKLRQTAKVEFDESGKVKQIKRRYGYGDQECEERIGASGHGYLVNLLNERERMNESMLGNGMMRMDDWREPRVLAPERIGALVEEAVQGLDHLSLAKVRQWLAEIMPTAEKAWGYEMQSRQSRYGYEMGSLSTGSYFKSSD
jgi:hypothetical protein